jgi:murein DD-endopeptidase MepM/ murein hydrolase activator NlpD
MPNLHRFCLLIAAVCLFFLVTLSAYAAAEQHTVRKGETLVSIAKKYNTTPQQIMRLNKISDPRRLQIGQQLNLPTKGSVNIPTDKSSEKSAASLSAPKISSDVITLPPSRSMLSPMLRSVIDLLEAPRVRRGRWKYVVIHHSGAAKGNARIIDVYHRQKGMENGLAYHFVIGNGHDSKDGQIEVGPRWIHQQSGGHLYDHHLNEISIGICLVGDFNRTSPTKRQIAAATELIRYLNQRCGGKKLIFRGHKEINSRPTDCPGRYFPLRAFHRLFN